MKIEHFNDINCSTPNITHVPVVNINFNEGKMNPKSNKKIIKNVDQKKYARCD